MKLVVPSVILLLSTIFLGCDHSNKPDTSRVRPNEISLVQKQGDHSKTPSCCSTLNKTLQKRKVDQKIQANCKH